MDLLMIIYLIDQHLFWYILMRPSGNLTSQFAIEHGHWNSEFSHRKRWLMFVERESNNLNYFQFVLEIARELTDPIGDYQLWRLEPPRMTPPIQVTWSKSWYLGCTLVRCQWCVPSWWVGHPSEHVINLGNTDHHPRVKEYKILEVGNRSNMVLSHLSTTSET